MMRRALIVTLVILAGQASAAFCSNIARTHYSDVGLFVTKVEPREGNGDIPMPEFLFRVGAMDPAVLRGLKVIRPWEYREAIGLTYVTQTWAPVNGRGPYRTAYIYVGPVVQRSYCFISWEPAPRWKPPR